MHVILNSFRQQYEAVKDLLGILAGDFKPTVLKEDLRRKIANHDGSKSIRKCRLEIARPRNWLSQKELLSARKLGIFGLKNLIQEREQGITIHQMDAADVLNLADGLHELLGSGSLEIEDVLDVASRPGLDDGVFDAIADFVNTVSPFESPGHELDLQIMPVSRVGK